MLSLWYAERVESKNEKGSTLLGAAEDRGRARRANSFLSSKWAEENAKWTHSSLGNLSRWTGGATSWLTGKLKPQQRNERDYCSGCFIKDPADSLGTHDFDKFTGSTEQSFKDGEALYYGLLDFVEDDLINSVRILSDLASSIHWNFRAHNLPPGLSIPPLAPLSFLFRWFRTSLGDHIYSGFVFWVVPNLVSQSQIFSSWVPAFLISFSLINFPMKPLWESNSLIY